MSWDELEAQKSGWDKLEAEPTAWDQLEAYDKDQSAKREAFLANPKTQVAKQVLASTADFAAKGVDFLTSPVRAAAELALDKDLPELEIANYIDEDVLPDSGSIGGLKNLSEGIGMGLSVAPGFVSVARSGGTLADTAADIAGLGQSVGTKATRQAERTASALTRASDSSALSKSDPQTRAQQIADELDADANRAFFNRQQKITNNNQKAVEWTEKNMEAPASPILTDDIQPVRAANIQKVAEQMQKEGFSYDQAIEGIVRGGIRFDRDMDELINLDKPLKGLSGYKKGSIDDRSFGAWYDRTFLPVADVLRKYVDPVVGGKFERAIENGLRTSERLVMKHGEGLKPAIELLNTNRDLKRMFLDVGQDPKKMNEILLTMGKKLKPQEFKAFTRFMRDSLSQNKEAQQRLFKKTNDPAFNEKWYFHTQKTDKSKKRGVGSLAVGKPYTKKPSSLRTKSRKEATLMKNEEVDMYENPIISHMAYMAEQQQLLNLSKTFNVRPALGGAKKDRKIDAFFNELGKSVARTSGADPQKAKQAGQIMHLAYIGSSTAPPPIMRAFMSLSYAGTLAQLKSATLNLHDAFVAAFRMGSTNTLKGMAGTLRSEFGQKLSELGLGNQGIGEFVKGMDMGLTDPTAMQKAAQLSEGFTNGAMFYSGFQKMDAVGKGIVLRTAVAKMRESARKGTLNKDFGEIASEKELRMAQEWLKSGKAVKDYPEEVAKIVEDMAFVQLGKQQLISYAGRPMNYLKYPMARPLYAMTGFAVKQQALLRDMIGSAIRQGDYVGAGVIAARYVAYAGLGYAMLDTFRDKAFKQDDVSEETFMLAIGDQILGAALMNKLDTGYGFTQFTDDPVEYLMESFLPPTGMTGALAESVVDSLLYVVTGGEKGSLNDRVIERFPLIGDFYKYYWKEE